MGIRDLAAHPRQSGRAALGERAVPVTFAGVTIHPGAMLHTDEDGLL